MMNCDEAKCVIWGTPANSCTQQSNGLDSNRGMFHLDLPRAGGEYEISQEALDEIINWSDKQKILLTNWLVEQRRLGNPCPKILTEISMILKIAARYQFTTGQIICCDI